MHTWLTSLLFLFCVRAGTVGKAQVPASYFSDFPLFFFLKMKSCFFFVSVSKNHFFCRLRWRLLAKTVRFLLDAVGSSMVLPSFTEFYRVLPGFTCKQSSEN